MDASVWIDAVSKIGFPAVFALILLFKVLPALDKIADALRFVGERLARIENEADIKPKERRTKSEALKAGEVGA